jgi:hypothetical protein
MDQETYEETRLKRDEWANFLKVHMGDLLFDG